MSKLDRLNARVSKLLTSAVEEVLEVVKDTVSEYQAKTARTQRENERLQRKLQELQQKLQQELAPVSRRNVLTQTTSSDTPTPTNLELDLSEAPAESVLKLEPRAVPNRDKEGEHYIGPLLHQQGELPAYSSVEIDKVDCALPLSVVTCSFGDESSLGHPDEINQRSPNDPLIRSCPADLHIIKAEPEGQESFLSTHAGAHTRTINQQHTSNHTHTLNQQLSGTHRHTINQQHTKAHRRTVNQQQTRGHRPALDDHLTESHGQTLDRQPGAGAAASPCDPAEVDVALDLLPPCGDRAPLHFMQSDSLNALMEELPLDNSQCSGVLPIEPTQGLESLPLVMTQGLGHRGQQRWWRRALRGDTHHCVLCGKTFGRLDNLRIHQRCHTGEKPYTCGHCGRRFSHAGNLKKHKRVHTGEKPYGCLQCGKMFSQSTHLKKHQKVHSHRYLTGS